MVGPYNFKITGKNIRAMEKSKLKVKDLKALDDISKSGKIKKTMK